MSDVSLPNHVLLEDNDGFKFELELQDGAPGFQESSSSPSSLVSNPGGTRFGDYDANFSHIEQRSFHGGRGNENFVDDQTRYFDSKELWSLTPNKLFPAPQWDFSKGLRTVDEYMPITRNVTWVKLIGSNLYQDVSFSSVGVTADSAAIFVRRRGTPKGNLTLELCADGTNKPGTVLKTVTKSTSDITDTISLFQLFDWTGTQSLTGSTTYYVKVYGNSADDSDHHWAIGVDAGTTGGQSSSNGTSWSSAAWKPFFRVMDAPVARTLIPFYLEGAWYVVSNNDDGSNSSVYINGDRGTASSGSSTVLTNSARTWVANRWAGARVKIIGGTGISQTAGIVSNTTTALTLDTTLSIALDNTSRYVIYKTPYWTTDSIGTHGLGRVVSVAVVNKVAYFAQGLSTNTRKASSSANTHTWAADGTNKSDMLEVLGDANGLQMFSVTKTDSTYKIANVSSSVVIGTTLSFGAAVQVGSPDYLITGMQTYNNQMYILKEDSVWAAQGTRVARVNIGLDGLPRSKNGAASAASGQFMYFNFWDSVERMLGSTVDDVGPQSDAGMPSGRRGYVSSMCPLLVYLFSGVNAGTGTSSMLAFQDRGYHELLRGWNSSYEIRTVFAQNNDDTNPYLWTQVGTELVYQELSLSPLKDSSFRYQHEAVLVSSTHDFGHAHTYKFFEELEADIDNLNKGAIHVDVDYQAGSDVGTDKWTPVIGLYISPNDKSTLEIGEVTKMRFRLRLQTNSATTPPVINALVLKGFEVVPTKRVWNLRIKVSSILTGSKHVDPNALYNWLWDAQSRARKIRMTTVFPGIQNVNVKLEPPSTVWQFINKAAKWTGVIFLTVREM